VKQFYYTLPLTLDKILQKQEHEQCSLRESVQQHIHLILTTAFGELTNDEGFGCWIWENDFDNLTSNNKIREYIKQSLLLSVKKYEPRIINARVEILIKQQELIAKINGRHVKKMLNVTVSGNLSATKEVIIYHDRFFTGPLSYY
jgi:phage baseplate assembly protein W